MKNRILALCLIVVCLFSFTAFPASAAKEKLTFLEDDAGLLTESERKTLTKQLEKILEEQNFVVAVVTMEILPDGLTAKEAADALYDELYGVDRDGCLLLRTLDPRYVYVTTTGSGTDLIDPKLEEIFDRIESDMKSDHYYAAFSEYAKLCEEYVGKTEEDSIVTDGQSRTTDGISSADRSAFFKRLFASIAGIALLFSQIFHLF